MTLKDTIPLMLSDDWRERLVAEYWQTKIRLQKLFDYERKCVKNNIAHDIYSVMEQEEAMGRYLCTLRRRIMMHGIPVKDENEREDKE